LRPDGSGKADLPKEKQRACFGPVAGGAVRLGMPLTGEWFAVGEGIETVLAVVVSCGISVDNIMAAALFRTIELARPTLLLDEADSYLGGNEDLRGIINSGHRRDGCVIRCVGDDHEPRQFATWAPLLLAQIGTPPATIYDRSIVVTLERKKPEERVEHFRKGARQSLQELARKAARWARDNATNLAQAESASLSYLDDRANDNWHALLAVAAAAGKNWPQRARQAAMALAQNAGHDGASVGEMLLADIRRVFDGRPEERDDKPAPLDKISSGELSDQLAKIEGRPWAEWKAGKPITQNALARLLKPFGVKPGTIRPDSGHTIKGYKREDFEDVFERWGSQSVTPSQPNNDGHFCTFQTVTPAGDVTVQKSQKPNDDGQCDGVTVVEVDLPVEEASWTV
jgi:putative DNA primase/helicase